VKFASRAGMNLIFKVDGEEEREGQGSKRLAQKKEAVLTTAAAVAALRGEVLRRLN
jgi:hypothetical protein